VPYRSLFRAAAPAALLLALPALLALLAAPAAALPRPEVPWIELHSPHFTLFSDAGERTARKIALDLERLRSALSQLNPGLELASPVPTWIYLFKDTASFAPYRLLYQGRPQSGEGYFVVHPYGNHVAVNADPRRDVRRLIYHEYLHEVLANNYPDLPLWLNEGLAEYYSTFEMAGGEAKLGAPILGHVAWLLQHALIPLPQLVEVDTSSRDYNEGDRRGVFYAESWALVHYLLAKPERRARTAEYLHGLAAGRHGPDAFERAFGDLATLERDLRAYTRIAVFDTQRAPVAQDGSLRLEVSPLPLPDALYRLGDLLLQNGDAAHAAAEEHFRAALAAAPGHGPARAGLGRIAQDAGRLAEARAAYEQAAREAPDDFFLHYLYGLSLLEPAPDPPSLPRAKAALRRAVELRPGFAEGWGRLAQALTYETPLPADAAQVFETAFRLMPWRQDFAFNLAVFYARTGRRAQAQKLVDDVLVPGRRADLIERAQESLLLGEWDEIETGLVKKDKLEEAVPRLEALLPRMKSPERHAALEKRIDEIRGALDYNSFAGRYNRAIDFLNAGKDAEAIALLEELAAKTRNPGQADQARVLLERIKAGPRGKSPGL
jgi:tetratricopeptide (TPR) repeat protein